ncbi:kinesin-like protein kif22 [Phtheirospermum japonicum]|uniref:Kinesin-like protein kif22 n=1 Tax=Phtheirospermum japonicum TaxID=374723 RepID=A0A830BE40_9LAMI|nr:kinesin-like protein kif22 [Phtheirospermum japonicum]
MAPVTVEPNGVKSKRCSNPPTKVRIIGKIRDLTGRESENQGLVSNPWITVKKSKEDGSSEKSTVFFESQSTSRKDGYELDYCYEQREEINHIYSREIQPIVSEVFNGRNASVIALGAKGSGKTYTTQGSQEKPGLAVIAMSEILAKAKEFGRSVSVSMYEITQEHVKDLLNPDYPTIQVLEDAHGKINLKGLSLVPVKSISEFHNIYFNRDNLQNTQKLPIDQPRNKGLMVHVSSEDDKPKAKLANKINFVDLAGYEDPRKSGRDAISVAESNRKNKLLYALLNVVNAINSNETRVPFRESKLTRILQDSLGGTSHVLLLACLNPCFCQDSLSFISLVSRTCRSVKQVLTDSTNRSQTSAKVKVLSSLESGKALSASVGAKKQIGNSRVLSAKKASSAVKGRKLFDEVKRFNHNKTQLSCQSEDTSTLKSKILPDLSLVVAPFSLEEEAPQVVSNSECNPTVEPNENVKAEVESQSMLDLQNTLLPSDPNDKLKTDVSPQSAMLPTENVNVEAPESQSMLKLQNTLLPSAPSDKLETDLSPQSSMLLEEVSMREDNNSLNRKDYGSPLLSERIREISNNLKSLCASSTPLTIKMPEEVVAPSSSSQAGCYEVMEPKTPTIELNIARYCSPRGNFSNRGSGAKQSLVREYLNFLNSANKEELKSLKGIGEKRATYILELREESPEPFKSLDDLEDIGLSAKQIKGIMKQVAGDLFN